LQPTQLVTIDRRQAVVTDAGIDPHQAGCVAIIIEQAQMVAQLLGDVAKLIEYPIALR
jgi:hypothetical protein